MENGIPQDTAEDVVRNLTRFLGGGRGLAERTVPLTGASAATGAVSGVTTGSSVSAGWIAYTAALPTPSSTLRGSIRVLRGGTGVADRIVVCVKNTADGYEWRDL